LRNNELQIYYQPILNLSDHSIIKAEALLRWQHPQHGMINPAAFIPLAEESGLILPVGEWVFDQCSNQIKRWHKQFGHIIQISVNKSPMQFNQRNKYSWPDKLVGLNLPGNSINVEITEGLLLKNSPNVRAILKEFRTAGIEISIDDFGTGFSSLSYLKEFDIDYLKIDRSFTSNLNKNKTDHALIEAIILMAHKLDIRTIAEGVETQLQQDLLIELGCDFVQGYFYSSPVPIEEFEKLIVPQWDKHHLN
jgi:EAL domain-containing protein (putative c-di-GMP-specific phosphodiesterase class I)